MPLNPVIEMLGRRLRLALIGGSPGSFIGAIHRQAVRFDNRYEIVAGVLSSNPEKSKQAGLEIGLAPDRTYASLEDMLAAEANHEDGAEVIAACQIGKQADPLANIFPNSLDGLLGLKFIDRVIQSSEAEGKWIRC